MIYLFEEIDLFTNADFIKFKNLLSEQRLEKTLSYRNFINQKQSMIVYLLLRLCIFKRFNLIEKPEFIFKNGKPFISNYNYINFNFSHCTKAVACGISNKNIGLDVQEYTEYDHEISKDILTNSEIKFIEGSLGSLEASKRFTQLWTYKESYGKAIGSGILYDLNKICFMNKSQLCDVKEEYRFNSQLFETYVFTSCNIDEVSVYNISYKQLINECKNLKNKCKY